MARFYFPMDLIKKIENISWKAILLTPIVIILVFSLAYYFTTNYSPLNGLSISSPSYFDSLYFTIVTFSSLGYGDITPLGFSRLFATIEVILGLIFMGILISKLVSTKQDRMITRLYHLEYINMFREVRHVLSNKREELNEASFKIRTYPKNLPYPREIKKLFSTRSNIFRRINSALGGLCGFFEKEEERSKETLKELDIHHFEKLLTSIYTTLNVIQNSIIIFNKRGFSQWKQGFSRGDLKLIIKYSEILNDYIFKECESDKIKERHIKINKILNKLRSELQ